MKFVLSAVSGLTLSLSSIALGSIDRPLSQTDTVSYRNLTTAQYDSRLNQYKNLGYRPIDVEIMGGSSKRYGLVMRKNTRRRGWIIKTSLTNAAFSTEWKKNKDAGYRLIDQETYTVGSTRYYAGIWLKDGVKTWASHRNLTSSEFSEKFSTYKSQGLLPIDIEAYKVGQSLRYSCIWVQNTQNKGWALRRGMTSAEFSQEFRSRSDQGYKVYDFNSYRNGTNQSYAAIWIKDRTRTAVRRDMNSTSFRNYWAEYRDKGFRIEDLEVYRTKNGLRYAGVWVEDKSYRFNWRPRADVKAALASYQANNPAMGQTIAIAHRGQIKYIEGFGWADQDGSKESHGTTVYRLASISKAVTGTLGFILRDKNQMVIDQGIDNLLPGLPSQHNYNTMDLLSNRSMVRHYLDTNDPVESAGQVSSAWDATKLFMNDSLVSGNYNYSTHAYTIFAAAIEEATGKSYCSQLRTYLTTAHSLSSLSCENRSATKTDRSNIYTPGLNKINTPDNLSWKYAGGGLEASAYDLVRWGMKLDQNRIMSNASLQEMTTPPDTASSFAYGWDVGSHDGYNFFARSGGQIGARSYIRVYPAEDLVIVHLRNTSGNGNAQRQMTTAVANEILP